MEGLCLGDDGGAGPAVPRLPHALPGLAAGPKTEPAEVAANPAEFVGKCVSLEGWWRDIALYPSRAEAAQTDALSIVILDQRRVGLYLPKAQLDAAPQTAPRLVTIVGRVGGACATVAVYATPARPNGMKCSAHTSAL